MSKAVQNWLMLFVAIFLIGIFSGYDSRLQNRGYKIKNRFLRFFVFDGDLFEQKKKRPKKDRDKISLEGIIFYIMGAITSLVNIVLAILPDIPIAPVTIETDEEAIRVNTFNVYFSYKITLWLLCAIFFYIGIWCLRVTKFEEKRWERILYIVVSIILMIVSIGAAVIL